MKNIYRSIVCLLAVAAIASCAKTVSESANQASKRFLDAWMHVNHPDVSASGLGIYVLDQSEGTGVTVEKGGYAIVEFVVTDLEGNISSYTDKMTAKQLGVYDTTTYYGPEVWLTADETIQAGLQDAVVGMKVGGSKKVVIPSWLMTYSKLSSASAYFNSETDYSTTVYDFKVVDYAKDINNWQISKMKEFMDANYGGLDTFEEDTTGFYYKRLSEKTGKEKAFPSDTTIYINYTGKLLNGLVFDTNIEKVALDNGLYNGSGTYGPVKITWSENYSGIRMGTDGSSVISGFALTLWNMKNLGVEGKNDKGIGVFYSPLGYSYSGSGASIPAYAPLVFEIEIVPEP